MTKKDICARTEGCEKCVNQEVRSGVIGRWRDDSVKRTLTLQQFQTIINLVCAEHVLMSVGQPTGARSTYQGPHPLRKLSILQKPSTFSSSSAGDGSL